MNAVASFITDADIAGEGSNFNQQSNYLFGGFSAVML